MPAQGYIVARQLDKDLFDPALAAEYAIFAGDHHGVGLGVGRQQLGGNIVIGVHFPAKIFAQGVGHVGRNIKVNTFEQRVTTALRIVAAGRHDKTPNGKE